MWPCCYVYLDKILIGGSCFSLYCILSCNWSMIWLKPLSMAENVWIIFVLFLDSSWARATSGETEEDSRFRESSTVFSNYWDETEAWTTGKSKYVYLSSVWFLWSHGVLTLSLKSVLNEIVGKCCFGHIIHTVFREDNCHFASFLKFYCCVIDAGDS